MAEHEHNHECNHNHPPSQSELEPAQPEIDDEPGDRPPAQFLSKQSRRAFLASVGTATALGLSQGFKRDPAEAKTELLAAADTIREAKNLHILKATPSNLLLGILR